jgi:hypothetical protein
VVLGSKKILFTKSLMQKGIIKTFLILILITTFSCSKKVEPHLLSQVPGIRPLEKLDHKLCTSLKLNIDGKQNFNSPYYWRCRLSFSKYRLATGQLNPEKAKRNQEISDLITQISLKISMNSESFISTETKKIDNRHHRQCLALGFTFETEDQAKIDEYFFCRKALIEEQQMVPPFGNQEYLKYPNLEYNLSYAVDRRIEKAIKSARTQAKQHPTCDKFNINSSNFKKCIIAKDNSQTCYSNITRKKFKKEWEEKISCQKRAYARFGDDLIKRVEVEEIITNTSDFENKSNFAAIGIDGSSFRAKEAVEEGEEERVEKRKEENSKTNSKAGLYSKYEITKLRYRYVQACSKNSNQKIVDFVKKLEKSCASKEKFDLIGE